MAHPTFHAKSLAAAIAMIRHAASDDAAIAFGTLLERRGRNGAALSQQSGFDDETANWAGANAAFMSAFGMPLIDPTQHWASSPVAELSVTLGTFISVAPHGFMPPEQAPPVADAIASRWIEILRAAARSARGHHLLHRCAARSPGGRSRETARLRALVESAEIPVSVVRLGPASLLQAFLHRELWAGDRGSIVIVDDDLVETAPEAKDDYHDPGDVTPAELTARRELVLAAAALADTRNTFIWRIAADTPVPEDFQIYLGAAFGPLQLDLRWREATLAALAPNIGQDASDVMLDRFADPRDARPVLRLAESAASAGVSFDATCVLSARSLVERPLCPPPQRPPVYDPDLFLSDHDEDDLLGRAEHIASAGGRLLLHGPPGGGKSSFATEFARCAAGPDKGGWALYEVRGSTIWTPKVGATERLVAKVFAESEGAILWLDECDSLMGRRPEGMSASAHGNGYLVRLLTNELLRALDARRSPVIAACNDLSALEPALVRRFDFVVRVDVDLSPDRERHAWRTILRMAPPETEGWMPIGATCIADYAAAARRCRMLGQSGARDLADAVRRARDARLGTAPGNRYGFLR